MHKCDQYNHFHCRLNDLMLLSNEQLAQKLIEFGLRANELTSAIHLSKQYMDKMRCDNQKAIRLERQMAQTHSKQQKNHYETIVTRHQEFIEQVCPFVIQCPFFHLFIPHHAHSCSKTRHHYAKKLQHYSVALKANR